jgi:hypothetical protein
MKRPVSVTLISCLFIIAGATGIVFHASELKEIGTEPEAIWVLVVRLLAIVGGLFVLRSANWARWLLVAWIVYHVILSFYHSTAELAIHAIITVVVLIALFHKGANAYFVGRS